MASQTQKTPFWRDVRVLRVAAQLFFLGIVLLIGAILVNNILRGLERTGLTPSFDFLNNQSQFQIDEGLVPEPHKRTDTYLNAFIVGFINTLRVAAFGLVLATLLGLVMGVARLSRNWLVKTIATVYIEIMQNTPLLIQLYFLYAGVFLAMPRAQQAVVLPGPSYLSIRGLAMPTLVPGENAGIWLLAVFASLVIGTLVWRTRRRIRIETGETTYALEIGLSIILLTVIIGWIALPTPPFTISFPRIIGSRYAPGEGAVISPEFTALLTGLVLYTGAFIAEAVRSGIQSVPHGQWEAARTQGFTYFQTLRLIVLPQALRVMVPPLTNQYINLIKNSSLGAAVGYSEFFGVSNTIVQSGQTVPVIIVVMLTYLILDLFTTFVMNVINARISGIPLSQR